MWHPTRASIVELLKSGPASRSELSEKVGVPLAEIRYHCRALCNSGCIKYADSSGPDASDPIYEAN